MLAVPEINRTVMPLMSKRRPREKDDGFGYWWASFRTVGSSMAFLRTTISAPSAGTVGSTTRSCLLIRFTFLVGFMDTVAQPRGRGHPNVFALKRHIQHVVVRQGSGRFDLGHFLVGCRDDNFPFSGVLVRPIGDPGVCFKIEIAQSFVGAGPYVIAAGLRGVDEIRCQAAVGGQVIVPIVAVVTAHPEISGGPEHFRIVVVRDVADDDMNQSLILEQDDLHLSIRVGVGLPVAL